MERRCSPSWSGVSRVARGFGGVERPPSRGAQAERELSRRSDDPPIHALDSPSHDLRGARAVETSPNAQSPAAPSSPLPQPLRCLASGSRWAARKAATKWQGGKSWHRERSPASRRRRAPSRPPRPSTRRRSPRRSTPAWRRSPTRPPRAPTSRRSRTCSAACSPSIGWRWRPPTRPTSRSCATTSSRASGATRRCWRSTSGCRACAARWRRCSARGRARSCSPSRASPRATPRCCAARPSASSTACATRRSRCPSRR